MEGLHMDMRMEGRGIMKTEEGSCESGGLD
jgi:hypothetical protein